MTEPFIFLCSEITRENAYCLIEWLQDEDVRRYLSDSQNVSESITQVINRVNLPVLTHLFNRDGRFFMVCTKSNKPVGFVRLIVKDGTTEIVIVIGDRRNWGMRLGTYAIRESMKIAFFEMRSERIIAKIHKENIRSIRAFRTAGFRLYNETASSKHFSITLDQYIKRIKDGCDMAGEILITEIDKSRLSKLIGDELHIGVHTEKSINALQREIEKATIVSLDKLPADVITMNSRALLCLNGDEMEVSLVYPDKADWDVKQLSIFSPVGTAILGYREGDTIEWEVPSGVAEIKIIKVLYQPEAVGDYHL